MYSRMKRKTFSNEEMAAIIKEYADGATFYDIKKKHGIAEGTFFRWKAKFEGLSSEEIKARRQKDRKWAAFEKKLKEKDLEIKALKGALRKKF